MKMESSEIFVHVTAVKKIVEQHILGKWNNFYLCLFASLDELNLSKCPRGANSSCKSDPLWELEIAELLPQTG